MLSEKSGCFLSGPHRDDMPIAGIAMVPAMVPVRVPERAGATVSHGEAPGFGQKPSLEICMALRCSASRCVVLHRAASACIDARPSCRQEQARRACN